MKETCGSDPNPYLSWNSARWGVAIIILFALLHFGCGQKSVTQMGTPAGPSVNWTTFHFDSQRTGWNSSEMVLAPSAVSGPTFGPIWNSSAFDTITIQGVNYAPHMYATPLYVDNVAITSSPFNGARFSIVIAATSNGWIYAVSAFDSNSVLAGTILWRSHLGTAATVPKLDGGTPLGILSTPVIDLNGSPARIYAASDISDSDGRNWKVFALDLGSGAVLPGWPLTINDAAVSALNQNGPAQFQATEEMSQRGALNLSPDGHFLYVPFASYGDVASGFMVSIDTQAKNIASAFSSAPSSLTVANGGIWGSGGAAIDKSGHAYATTGNSPDGSANGLGVWGDSVLKWDSGTGLRLIGTYTPWNYCQMDTADIDLAASSPMILPDLDPSTTATPHLLLFGSKQGTVYLLNRDNLPGGLDRRPPCNFTQSSQDTSLLPLDPQPPFAEAGPLSVFGPYSETCAQGDYGRMRTTPAYFRASDGTNFIFVSGAQKASECDRTPVPPGLVRLKLLMSSANGPASLKVDAQDSVLALLSPGPPVISSNGSADAVVWILDANVFRSTSLQGSTIPHPVLYAVDESTMQLLWKSASDQLDVGGKYNHVAVAHGAVFVGTDRIQAFGLHQ